MELPKFKYIEDLKDIVKISETFKKCDCCEKDKYAFVDTMDERNICIDCVHSGQANQKFDYTFNEGYDSPIDNQEAIDELSKRTPNIPTFQDFPWPDCCNDFLRYLRVCTDKDLKNQEILSDLEETFDEEWINFKDLFNIHPSYLLLYRCLHCGKHYIIVDTD